MTHLHTVVAVGQFAPRWFYPERIEGICYIGRFWTHRHHSSRLGTPHWSQQQARVSLLSVTFVKPAEPKPEPPAEVIE